MLGCISALITEEPDGEGNTPAHWGMLSIKGGSYPENDTLTCRGGMVSFIKLLSQVSKIDEHIFDLVPS